MPQPLILIVDDDSPHRSMLRTVLRGWGYAVFGKVVAGTDVVDAIAAVRTASRSWYGDVPVEDVVMEKVEEI